MPDPEKQNRETPVNLADMFLTSARKHADKEALKYRPGHHYHMLSYGQLKGEVMRLTKALMNLGLKEGDRALIISKNRPEWVISDLAMMCLGIVNVPVHDVLSATQIGKIIEEVSPDAIFFSGGKTEVKLSGINEIARKATHLISFDKTSVEKLKDVFYFRDLIDLQDMDEKEISYIEEKAKKIKPDTLASISYTSGTSGNLKGVMLTHNNFIQNIEGINGSIFGGPEDKLFSILPLSHVFERTAGYYVPIRVGSSIGYAVNLSSILEEMKERKPTVILAAPRFFEKVYENIMLNVNTNPVKKYLFRAAFSNKARSGTVEKIFDKIVFSKVKNIFGGNLRYFISGGAKLSEEIGRFFERSGLVILEGYGLTETSPVIACNRLDRYKFGTVGGVLNNLSVKIGENGEILVKGPSVISSYLRKSDNEGVFTEDGYFRTGDLGYIDRDGFLVITGRSKDLVVLSTGKKIVPSIIEEALQRSPYIEQAVVIGEGKKHVGAIIIPSFRAIENKIKITGRMKILKDVRVNRLIAREVFRLTKDLASIERIEKFILLNKPFSVKAGELTPKLSLCRSVISARYKEMIEDMYRA